MRVRVRGLLVRAPPRTGMQHGNIYKSERLASPRHNTARGFHDNLMLRHLNIVLFEAISCDKILPQIGRDGQARRGARW